LKLISVCLCVCVWIVPPGHHYIRLRTSGWDHEIALGAKKEKPARQHQNLWLYFSVTTQRNPGKMMTRIYAFIGLLLLILIQSSLQIPIQENMEENSSLMSEEALFNDPREVNNMKRHSEGTFSNDYSKYLETRRAQDFVQWLMNSKRSG
ncbi:hypothetical protein cypCar_00014630, partial [Cyprinus carpio]